VPCLDEKSRRMIPTISSDQRNLLYDHILNRLSGIADIWRAVDREDYGAAQRLGVAVSDDLRLITEDLGWGEHAPSETIVLKTPPDVLRRALARMRDEVQRDDAWEEEKWGELRENQEGKHLLAEVCQRTLAHLDAEPDDESTAPSAERQPPSRLTMFPISRPLITIHLGKRRKRSP
jgi:hypothetical protein